MESTFMCLKVKMCPRMSDTKGIGIGTRNKKNVVVIDLLNRLASMC